MKHLVSTTGLKGPHLLTQVRAGFAKGVIQEDDIARLQLTQTFLVEVWDTLVLYHPSIILYYCYTTPILRIYYSYPFVCSP